MQAKFGLPLGLIIIDTMSAAAGFRDANDASETQRVMDLLGALAKEAQTFTLVVDHFGKNSSTGTRNSSARKRAPTMLLLRSWAKGTWRAMFPKPGLPSGRLAALRPARKSNSPCER